MPSGYCLDIAVRRLRWSSQSAMSSSEARAARTCRPPTALGRRVIPIAQPGRGVFSALCLSVTRHPAVIGLSAHVAAIVLTLRAQGRQAAGLASAVAVPRQGPGANRQNGLRKTDHDFPSPTARPVRVDLPLRCRIFLNRRKRPSVLWMSIELMLLP